MQSLACLNFPSLLLPLKLKFFVTLTKQERRALTASLESSGNSSPRLHLPLCFQYIQLLILSASSFFSKGRQPVFFWAPITPLSDNEQRAFVVKDVVHFHHLVLVLVEGNEVFSILLQPKHLLEIWGLSMGSRNCGWRIFPLLYYRAPTVAAGVQFLTLWRAYTASSVEALLEDNRAVNSLVLMTLRLPVSAWRTFTRASALF